MMNRSIFRSFALFLSLASALASEDLLLEDFEQSAVEKVEGEKHDHWSQGVWEFEGGAFLGYGSRDFWQPGRFDRGALLVLGYQGSSLLKSWGQQGKNIDGETGRALSPLFEIQRKYLHFLLSGGRYPSSTCLNLLIDGEVVCSATGSNSNRMESLAFDLSSYLGKSARLEVIDRETGAWGHLCVDRITQSDVRKDSRLVDSFISGGTDVVWFADRRVRGRLYWSADGLSVDDLPVDPALVRSFSILSQGGEAGPKGGSVLLQDGELWQCEIVSMAKGKLRIRSKLLGEITIDQSSVHSIRFQPEPESQSFSDLRPGILYRDSGSPVPGKLAWIKSEDLALDSALGILPIPRSGLLAYVFPGTVIKKTEQPVDEVGLKDGSVFFGQVLLEQGKAVLARSGRDSLVIPWEKLRYLVRSGKETFWLRELTPSGPDSTGPLGIRREDDVIDFRSQKKTSLSAIRLMPVTKRNYRIPSRLVSAGGMLQMLLTPLANSRGTAELTFSMDGKKLLNTRLGPASKAQKISLLLPKGDELTVEVEFGERIIYPCGIEMHDAHLAIANEAKGGRK